MANNIADLRLTAVQWLFRVLIIAIFLSRPAPAAEPWADDRLAPPAGLVVWLDSSAQNAAREHQDQSQLEDGDPLAVWYDGSGNDYHVESADLVSQPTIRRADEHLLLRFNGESNSLSTGELDRDFDEATLFIVAAPLRSDGGFRALASFNEKNKQDYTSGINVDLGPYASGAFDTINVEGRGFGGAENLMEDSNPLGEFHQLCVAAGKNTDEVRLFVDGAPQGARSRQAETMTIHQLTIGARYYGNPPTVRSHFAGEIAEVLIFDRHLTEQERRQVSDYLEMKYEDLDPIPTSAMATEGRIVKYLDDVPPVQLFVPGFTVKELPVELTNINNVLYRRDGKLVALAYDGNIYLLSDRNGDGLEETAELYWENNGRIRAPIGMDLTPAGYDRGDGVLVTSKLECLLVLDTNGDDQADEVVTVAEGWPETFHGVDALGMAIDPRDGSIYFGIGTQNFADAYVRDEDGDAQFDVDGQRGTIQRVSPDFSRRETIATGIRFPVAIRINKHGNLFCTDQEGATWLPNGNPLDELLHIHRDRTRHYGFPPRHPQHLPGVIDEPSVFDYGPQHQSTCGLNFNEPIDGGPPFGPAWWEGDAIVTGYSRGKLYRTALAKTSAGYVAQNQLIGSVAQLTADACVGPRGALVIATHSGPPDWGSGPGGNGKLFKIFYSDRDAPIPVKAWPRTPEEVQIAFDRPLDPQYAQSLVEQITIECGRFVAAGDRFEQLHPPYALVARQASTPRFEIAVSGASLTPDRRTLILSTAPHRVAANYAVTLPGGGRQQSGAKADELPQVDEIDLAYDLTGVQASWQPDSVELPWNGWIPHLDLAAARRFTLASAEHDALWQRIKGSGTLTLRTQLRLERMLRPDVQPGSELDFTYPPEETTIHIESNCAMNVAVDGDSVAVDYDGNRWHARLDPQVLHADKAPQLEVRLQHDASDPAPSVAISYHTNEDATPRALALTRMVLPWATLTDDPQFVVDNRDVAELEGGNWIRGKEIFFSDQAMCSRCHPMRGQGGSIGPDLSNLPQRDYASVVRDIQQPSYAINPDFVSHSIETTNGRFLVGTLRTDGEELLIGHQDGQQTSIRRNDVEAIRPSSVSVMPEKISELLGPEKMRDLLTYLLLEPPSMPNYGPLPPPPPRSMREVDAVLAGADRQLSTRPLNVVLVSGRKDHGPGEHDYPAWQKAWRELLAMAVDVQVTCADQWPTKEQLQSADVLVFYQQGQWTPDRAEDLDAFLNRGGGVCYIHFAVDGGQDAPGFARRIGLAWRGGYSKFRHGPLAIDFSGGSDHPIARNFETVRFHDESYWNLLGDAGQVRVIGTGLEEGSPQPLFWTTTHGTGRVFVSIPGHFAWTFDDPLFRTLVLRGIAWSANEPVDRFNHLVTPGARIRPITNTSQRVEAP